METLSIFIQLIGGTIFSAFVYNVALLIINQLKTK
jgi:hypothetical protein